MTAQHLHMAMQARYAEYQLPRRFYDESPAARPDTRPRSRRRMRTWVRRSVLAS